VSVYQVVIDTASRQISVRFGDSNTIMQDASYLDPKNFKTINEDPSVIPQGALQSLAKMSSVEQDGLVDQLISFASIYYNISNNTEYESNDSENDKEETLTRCSIDQNYQKCIPCAINLLNDFNLHSRAYSDLYIIYETLLTISFTQVSCARSFSKLKIIKTRLRSLIGQDWLESLILINSEADIISEWNYDDIIDKLASTSNEMKRLLS